MKSLFSVLLFSIYLCLMAAKVYAQEVSPSAFAPHFQYSDAKISPNGKYLAVRMMSKGKSALVVLDASTFKPVGGLNMPLDQEVGRFFWANDTRIVTKIYEKRAWSESPQDYGELFAVDYDGSDGELIYSFRNANSNTRNSSGSKVKQKESVRGWASVIDRLEGDDEHILISSQAWDQDGETKPLVHKLNIYDGTLGRPITRSPLSSGGFISDRKGKVKYSFSVNEGFEPVMYEYDGEKDSWSLFDKFALGPGFNPLGLNKEGTELYLFNNAVTDKTTLYRYNIANDKLNEIYGDNTVDIFSVIKTEREELPYAIHVESGYPEYLIINQDESEAQVFKNVLATFPGVRVMLTSSTENGDKWVIHTSSDTSPDSWYLYDKKAGAITFLFKAFNAVPENQLAKTEPFFFEASDGMTLQGYLTRPVKSKGDAPLVTLVHGGPHARDVWYFDREVQMLASQGYAVLQVNFRGSTGFGVAYEAAGYKQWGGRVQQDIIETTQWAQQQEGIHASKACIMGASFGGYSALQSSILAPDLFQCTVANVGVYDLEMLFEEGDIPEKWFGKAYLTQTLGNDKQQLQAFSPVHHVEKLKSAVFIAHGEEDQRVPIEQAEALKKQLDKHDKNYVWFVKDYEGHGFYSPENRAEYYEAVASFMAKYLK